MEKQREAHSRPSRVVGLIADPGIAQNLANKVHQRLEKKLNSDEQRQFNWQIMIDPLSLPLSESGSVTSFVARPLRSVSTEPSQNASGRKS